MATIVNNPTTDTAERSTGVSFLFGALLLVALVFALLYWGFGTFRAQDTVNIRVPDRVNLDVNTPLQ